MTFATGQTGGRARCRRGFTLIELILVLTLLAVAASLIAPRLSSFVRGRALDSEARRLLSLTRAAQSRAISEGMPMLLWVNAVQGGYGVEREATAAHSDPKALEFSTDGNVQIAVMNLASGATTLRNMPAIRFLPDGTIDENSPQTLRLNDSTGATLWLIQARNRMSYEIRNTDK
jgi:type II secretion system protein H